MSTSDTTINTRLSAQLFIVGITEEIQPYLNLVEREATKLN